MNRWKRLLSAGVLLGTGLGGFVDGIVFHQMLQWHNMISSLRPPTDLVTMKLNMLWDGVFHAFTWLMVCLGVWRLWAAATTSEGALRGRVLIGAMLLGWGAFNSIEGLIDHQIAGLHHVHPGDAQLAWDLGFIAFGLVLFTAGIFLLRGTQASRTAS